MSNLTRDEKTFSTRLGFEIQQRSSLENAEQLKKDLETVIEHRTSDEFTATEFFVQLKRIEYSLEGANGKSKGAFLALIQNELSLSHASTETVAHVSKLLSHNGALSHAMMAEASDYCVISWRAALGEASRDSNTGRFVSLALLCCLIVYLVLTKFGTVISEANVPFSQVNPTPKAFWGLAADSLIRVSALLGRWWEPPSMVLGVAGAALNLFRKGVRVFEINMMFRDQIPGTIAVHLAIGAWSGFLAGYLLQYLVASIAAEKDSGGALRNFVVIVGCFAAGYSSWFVDAAIDKLWRKLEFTQRGKTTKPY